MPQGSTAAGAGTATVRVTGTMTVVVVGTQVTTLRVVIEVIGSHTW